MEKTRTFHIGYWFLACGMVAIVHGWDTPSAQASGSRDPDANTARVWYDQKEDAAAQFVSSEDGSAIQPADGGVAGVSNCLSFGGYSVVFGPATNRFRGNFYLVQETLMLERIEMELDFSVSDVALYFSVHEETQALSNTYTRIYPTNPSGDPVITSGTGRAFYASALIDPPVMLQAGKRYVIGAAWGPIGIKYGRDQLQTYPKPFAFGQTLGGATLPTTEFPIGDVPGWVASTDGAYSLRLCFAPREGACCNIETGCEIRLDTNCPAALFQGGGTLCIPGICVFGACCLPCGDCVDTIENDCEDRGGTWLGPATSCAQNEQSCVPVVGACCIGLFGTCNVVCEEECAKIGGVYHGDGSLCLPENPCHGACCHFSAGCLDTSGAACDLISGAFRGEGTSCSTLPSALECGGACCFAGDPPTNCIVVAQRAACSNLLLDHAHYLGDGSSCPINCSTVDLSDYHACCLPDGNCIVASTQFCEEEILGQSIPNQDSCPASCPGTGACCLADGQCLNRTPGGCQGLDGVFHGVGSQCGIATCGACCVSSQSGSSCTLVPTSQTCTLQQGEFLFDGACDGSDCPTLGACCLPDGSCAAMTLSGCAAIAGAGSFQGNGTSCTVAACQGGSCCAPNGSCSLVASGLDCTNGTFNPGGTCTPNTCVPMGACCRPNGTCQSPTTSPLCNAAGGAFTIGANCATHVCPAVGACCAAGGCTEVTMAACVGGDWQGANTVCDPDPCEMPSQMIVSSDPPNNAIDARQPLDPNTGVPFAGFQSIVLTLDSAAAGLTPGDFSITVDPAGTAPIIAMVVPAGNTVTLTFSDTIPVEKWTTITLHGSQARIGFLPGDVNNDKVTNANDILSLINHINTVIVLQAYQTDINHDLLTNANDILSEINVINGAGLLDAYLNHTLPN